MNALEDSGRERKTLRGLQSRISIRQEIFLRNSKKNKSRLFQNNFHWSRDDQTIFKLWPFPWPLDLSCVLPAHLFSPCIVYSCCLISFYTPGIFFIAAESWSSPAYRLSTAVSFLSQNSNWAHQKMPNYQYLPQERIKTVEYVLKRLIFERLSKDRFCLSCCGMLKDMMESYGWQFVSAEKKDECLLQH